jgi:signal transduction histidine kinase
MAALPPQAALPDARPPDAGLGAAADSTPAGGAAGDPVAWLVCDVVPQGAAEGHVGSAAAVALSRVDCLTIAAALVAGTTLDAALGTAPPSPGPASLGTRVPVVADWVRRWRAVTEGPGCPDWRAFALALVVPEGDEPRGGRGGLEASVLRGVVEWTLAREAARERFDRAVMEARLEGLRELAYGASHEINNPLANIATRAQALLLDEEDAERRRRLSTIVDQSFRARDMIGGLMLFARPPKPRPEAVEAGRIVAGAIDAVRAQAAARQVRVEYVPPPTPAEVFVDRGQIEEAVRVVAVNAIEAVAAGGRVVFAVAPAAAGMCELTVADDGRGMPAETARRACDPFFSGREAGRGAGLGLPKAWRFVESNGGSLQIDSRPGQGTKVSMLLPAAGPAGNLPKTS